MNDHASHTGWAFYAGLLDALTYVMGSAKGYLRDHGARVAHLARQLARHLALEDDFIADLLFAGILADLGMIGLVEEAWENPKPQLSAQARARVIRHPGRSEAIVMAIPHLESLAPLVRHHHEWWDGSGYPDGLQGDAIPLGAQILRLADTVSALGQWRPHRPALPLEKILRIVEESRGQEFGPEVADSYLRLARHNELAEFHPNVFHRQLMRASSLILPDQVSPLSSEQLLEILAALIDAKDPYTAGHSRRVAELSVACADELDMGEHVSAAVWAAGYLHDIGKVGVPLRILAKEGPLDDDEFEAVRAHTHSGAGILEEIPSLRQLAPGARYHHERWDGHGYPEGISGERIPLIAQILAIADAYDAMTSKRSYRDGRSHEEAMQEIAECSGRHFAPGPAAAFLALPDGLFQATRQPRPEDQDPFRTHDEREDVVEAATAAGGHGAVG